MLKKILLQLMNKNINVKKTDNPKSVKKRKNISKNDAASIAYSVKDSYVQLNKLKREASFEKTRSNASSFFV